MRRGAGRFVLCAVMFAGCKPGEADDEVSDESSESGSESATTSETSGSTTIDESGSTESAGESADESETTQSGSGSTEGGSTEGGTTESGSTEGGTTEGGEGCPEGELQEPLPITVMGSTIGMGDDFEACGDPGGLDVSHAFTAPETGVYVFDSLGSSFDTVLYVSAGACEPTPALVCNDDAHEDSTSQVWLGLDAGELVTIHLDGLDAESFGDYVLSIDLEPDPCPMPSDIGSSVPDQVGGMLAPGPGEMAGSCGGGGNEVFVQWTAPAAGSYVFDTIGSSFDTVLHVRDATCFDELACNDDGVQSQSLVEVELAAGQTIVLVLDAFGVDEGGSYVLNIAGA